jgi:hypothetical protein
MVFVRGAFVVGAFEVGELLSFANIIGQTITCLMKLSPISTIEGLAGIILVIQTTTVLATAGATAKIPESYPTVAST